MIQVKAGIILTLWIGLTAVLLYRLIKGVTEGDMDTIRTTSLLLVPDALVGFSLIIELTHE